MLKYELEVWTVKKPSIFKSSKTVVFRGSLIPVGNVFETTDVAYSTLYVLEDNSILLRQPRLKNARDLFNEYAYAGKLIRYEVGEVEFAGETVRAIMPGWAFDPSVPTACITFEQYKHEYKRRVVR